jgi:threonine/homoserine/homoserine lactone efflux protein
MDAMAVLSVMAATAINSAMPGPCMILIAAQTARGGARGGLRTSLGIAAAQMIYASVALALLILALSISDTVHTVIRLVGAGVLVLLALGMLTQTASTPVSRDVSGTAAGSGALLGLGVGLSSPFNLVFMFSVLPQFVSREALLDPTIFAVFLGIFVATMGPMIATVWVANGARAYGQRFVTLLVRTGGVVLMVFAGNSIASVA